MKILITYALEDEKGDIQIPGNSVVYCCTGIGKVSTAISVYEALLSEKPDLVLNIGTSGTLNHRVGDILICTAFLDRDLEKISSYGVPFRLDFADDIFSKGFLKNHNVKYTVSTGDIFQTEESESSVNADVYDMEAYACAQVCRKMSLPFVSVKYVTDIIGQNSIKHWEDKLHEGRAGLEAFLRTVEF